MNLFVYILTVLVLMALVFWITAETKDPVVFLAAIIAAGTASLIIAKATGQI